MAASGGLVFPFVVPQDIDVHAPFWNDASFTHLLDCAPHLRGIRRFFPADLSQQVFPEQARIERLWSSYKHRGYGHLFYGLVRHLRPQRCVELGVLQGFSLLTVGAALRANGVGRLEGFDLFEDYPYHHEPCARVTERIEQFDLGRWVTIHRMDALEAHRHVDAEVDLLHVDLSNTGDTYRAVFERWADRVRGLILLEGGGAERDRVEWMIKYRKPAMAEAITELRAHYQGWQIVVLEPYPSLTVAVRTPDTGGANHA